MEEQVSGRVYSGEGEEEGEGGEKSDLQLYFRLLLSLLHRGRHHQRSHQKEKVERCSAMDQSLVPAEAVEAEAPLHPHLRLTHPHPRHQVSLAEAEAAARSPSVRNTHPN